MNLASISKKARELIEIITLFTERNAFAADNPREILRIDQFIIPNFNLAKANLEEYLKISSQGTNKIKEAIQQKLEEDFNTRGEVEEDLPKQDTFTELEKFATNPARSFISLTISPVISTLKSVSNSPEDRKLLSENDINLTKFDALLTGLEKETEIKRIK